MLRLPRGKKNSKKEKKDNSPHKTWRWTLNNYTEEDVKLHHMWSEDCTRMRVSKEVGEEKGTPHLQCVATFRNAKRFTSLFKMHKRCIWLVAVCDDFLYEAKEGSEVIINVDNRRQGERSDLTDLAEAIKQNASKRELWTKHSEAMIKFHRGAYEMMTVVNTVRETGKFTLEDFQWERITDWSKTHILWGEAGIGKTQFALAHFKNPLFVSHVDTLGEFDPTEHDGIIFDDMNFMHRPREEHIKFVDQDQTRDIHIRYKTARIPANTKKIFTTNVEEGRIFFLDDGAIARRVTVTEVARG